MLRQVVGQEQNSLNSENNSEKREFKSHRPFHLFLHEEMSVHFLVVTVDFMVLHN